MFPPLPGMPCLDRIRKQAKLLVKKQKEGDLKTCRVLRWISRFAGKTDEQILSCKVSHGEALHAIANHYGFTSWEELHHYVEVKRSVGNGPDVPEVPESTQENWQAILNTLAALIGIPAALIMRVSGKDIEVFLSSQTKGNPYKPGDKECLVDSGLYCETVIKSRAKLLVPNALTDDDWCNNPDIKLGMISYLGYPLFLPNGRAFGTICVLDSKENGYSEMHEVLLSGFRELVEHHLALIHGSRLLGRQVDWLREFPEDYDSRCMQCTKLSNEPEFLQGFNALVEQVSKRAT